MNFLLTTSTIMVAKYFKKPAILLFWLVIWQATAQLINAEIIIPTPYSTLNALLNLSKTSGFYFDILFSLLRIIVGFILGVVVGFLGAVLSNKFKLFSNLFSPVLKVIKAVPVASFIILAFYWFNSNILPVFICFLMVLPMVWISTQTELNNIDEKYIELAKIYRLSSRKIFFQIKLPFIMPTLISTVLTALGFAWKSGIAAEVICRPNMSLGNLLQESKIYLQTPEVFAVTAVVALLSIILEWIVKRVVRRYTNDKN